MKKKFTFKSMLLLCALVVGINTSWADSYTITFKTGSGDGTDATTSTACSDVVSEGSSYLSGDLVTATRVYYAGSDGLKLGASKNKEGEIKMNLASSVTPTSIVVNAKLYNSSKATTLSVNDSDAQSISSNFSDLTFSITSEISYIQLHSSQYCWIKSITVNYTSSGKDDCDLALTDAPIALEFDLYGNADPQVIHYTTSSTGAVSIDDNVYATFDIDETDKTITVTPTKKTPSAQIITVNQDSDDDYNAGFTTFTVTITDSTPVSWVETSLANLTSGDVFVIVGNNGSNYAMTNNNGTSAPAASAVTIENSKITSDVTENIQWNLVITDGGYVFYPAGDATKWLYITGSEAKCKVGTSTDKTFILADNGYLQHTGTSKYIGIYSSQDWRGYSPLHSNIEDQTFAFYKKVYKNTSSYDKPIAGCGSATNNNTGYYLIASPVVTVDPTTSQFLNNSYDLYYFDQSQDGAQWQNYKHEYFNLTTGKGYLYANSQDVVLTFEGQPYNGNGVIGLIYDSKEYPENNPYFIGWNLIGNPYPTTAYLPKDHPFYKMNVERTELIVGTNSAIAAMEGVFVKATAANQTLTFTTTAPAKGFAAGSKIILNITDSKGNVIDRAIVRFDEGNTLPKFMLNENNTKLYIPREDDNYAVVLSDGKDNMPVNFKPATTGKYTLTVDTEGIDMNYLHLIDRFTGEDIDLLMDNTYSFVGSQIDNDSRFILSFTAKGYNVTSDEPFAYQSGSDIIVDGNGELQIFDVTGRKVMNTVVNGVQTINGLNNGFYIFKLNEKTQKIVVR